MRAHLLHGIPERGVNLGVKGLAMKSPAAILGLFVSAAGTLLAAALPAAAAASSVRLSVPNAASSVWDTDSSKIGVELQIMNSGIAAAEDVRVTGIDVEAGAVAMPTAFPVALGSIAPQGSALFDLVISAPRTDGAIYRLTIRGTFRAAGVTRRFSLHPTVAPSVTAPSPITAESGVSTVTPGGPAIPVNPHGAARPPGFGPNAATPMLIPPGPPRTGPPPNTASPLPPTKLH
jgi:hypothetical protein